MIKKKLLSLVLLLGLPFMVQALSINRDYGDVNHDGEVNIADVNAVIDVILSNVANPDADVNGDGEINIADINLIIDIISGSTEPVQNYGWVDLGLPSGTLWATCNVGASSPQGYGYYFAWGEISSKEVYNGKTYKWGDYDPDKGWWLLKYNSNSGFGLVDNKFELDPEDDAAYVNMGLLWRIPTVAQQRELVQYCRWNWTSKNGVYGQEGTGPNGRTIFLPAAGVRWDELLYYQESNGYYWSRSLGQDGAYEAYCLWFSEGRWIGEGNSRPSGFPVRAVLLSQN